MVRSSMLDAYLAALPNGLASYPSCVAKATIVRSALAVEIVEPDPAWPREIVELVQAPPLPTAWIPEALSVATHFAVADASGFDEDGILDWSYRANRRLAESRVYRALTQLASPSLLLRGAGLSWTMIHRGVDITVQHDENEATIRATHPAHLWSEFVHRSTTTGFRAVLESSKGDNVRVELTDLSPTHGEYRCTWDPPGSG